MPTTAELENWFTYHTPTAGQPEKYQRIREQAHVLALQIAVNCPDCADTIAAIRLLRLAVMTANQAIACGGK